MTIYDITVKSSSGADVKLEDYRGKVLLIVNTATKCGFTPQYDGLQALYDKYRGRGLEILDFPCNQFAGQAPGSAEEIASFCTLRFGTKFPQFEKIDVNGTNESPLYTWLKSQKGGALGLKVKWNFTKFLVGRDGAVAARFSSAAAPSSLEADIERLLDEQI